MIGGKFRPQGDSNKMEWILEFLEERGISAKPDGDGKVVIASQFAEVCDAISTRLAKEGIPSFVLTGETKSGDRIAMMEKFQTERGPKVPRVFILSTKAAGVSITLDAADDVIIVDETWIPDDQEQVEARCHRLSRIDHQVSVWYLRSLDSIEEAIAAVTYSRSAGMAGIMDKARGHEVIRRVQEYVKAS